MDHMYTQYNGNQNWNCSDYSYSSTLQNSECDGMSRIMTALESMINICWTYLDHYPTKSSMAMSDVVVDDNFPVVEASTVDDAVADSPLRDYDIAVALIAPVSIQYNMELLAKQSSTSKDVTELVLLHHSARSDHVQHAMYPITKALNTVGLSGSVKSELGVCSTKVHKEEFSAMVLGAKFSNTSVLTEFNSEVVSSNEAHKESLISGYFPEEVVPLILDARNSIMVAHILCQGIVDTGWSTLWNPNSNTGQLIKVDMISSIASLQFIFVWILADSLAVFYKYLAPGLHHFAEYQDLSGNQLHQAMMLPNCSCLGDISHRNFALKAIFNFVLQVPKIKQGYVFACLDVILLYCFYIYALGIHRTVVFIFILVSLVLV